MKRWSREEDIELIKFYPVKTNTELEKIFNRKKHSIMSRAARLKIKKDWCVRQKRRRNV